MALPTGLVTFLFADIEGSTRHLSSLGNAKYADLLSHFRSKTRRETQCHEGHEVDAQGDQVFFAFLEPARAVAAAVGIQRALALGPWPDGAAVRARIGLHTGEPMATEAGYVSIDVHQVARICAAGHGGQILISEATRNLIGQELPEEMDFRNLGMHRLKDLTRPQRLFQVIAPGLLLEFPTLRTLDAHPNNLPVQLSSFIGRARESAEIKTRLRDTRLVTLTGPGGCGKTRLALQVAAEIADEYPDGAWLVELAPVTDPALVTPAVSATVGCVDQAGRPLIDVLADFLSPKRAQLVLDNCEHLVDACAEFVNALLPRAAQVRILATSREGLGVPGEALYPVHPLTLPAAGEPPQVERLLHAEAAQLFVARAASVVPAFALSSTNAAAVTDICRRLDGIPLAIELAASLVQAMSPEEIAERVQGQFRLRAGIHRGTVSRHQTMQAALDWSYELLSTPERRLLRCLSIFAGPWTMKAAEAVCSGDGIKPSEIADLLSRLVVKSMVTLTDREGQSRYRLLETVREYARNRLVSKRESEAVSERHLIWYADWAEHFSPTVDAFADESIWWGPSGQALRAQVAEEHGNLLAALEYSLDAGRTDRGLHLLRVLSPFWYLGGRWEEGDVWFRKMLAAVPADSPDRAPFEVRVGRFAQLRGDSARAEALLEDSLRARDRTHPHSVFGALYFLAELAWNRGDLERVATLIDDSLSVAAGAGDRVGIAMAQSMLGSLSQVHADYEKAVAWHDQSLAIFRACENLGGISMQLRKLANLLRFQRRYDRAVTLAAEALQTDRALGSEWVAAFSLNVLGLIYCDRGNYGEAREALEEALSIARRLADREGTAIYLHVLARAALEQADFSRADILSREALALSREAGLKFALGRTLDQRGVLARHRGDLDEAATLLEESLRMARETKDQRDLAKTLYELGALMHQRGDHRHAGLLLRDSLGILSMGIWRLLLVRCLEAVGGVLAADGLPEIAVRLRASAAQARAVMGTPLPPVDQPQHEALIAGLRTLLGDAAFEVAWSEGASMDLLQAVADARAALEPTAANLEASA